ncbi:MAG: class I SAM-dependent methyltransferase [Thermoanaerobaculia bacterium]
MTSRSSLHTARYWDENREKSKDPAYWMAHPLCRQAINRRVSGDIHEWPLDWFRRRHVRRPFERGVSWGCGLGAFERGAIRTGIVCAIDAFDISPKSLEDARREAEKEAISGIEYGIGDFDRPRLLDGRYDVVFFHASLHHVRRLGRLFRALRRALRPGGAVYVDEYVGPSRGEWTRERLRTAQELLDTVPEPALLTPRIALPIEQNDPSEAIRSGEIVSFLRQHFEMIEWRPYGGQIAALLFPNVSREWTESPDGLAWVSRVLEVEQEQILRDPSSTFYLVAYGRLRPEPARVTPSERLSRLRGRWRAEFPGEPRGL